MSIEWLLENSGAVIKYRTQLELMNINIKNLNNDMADIIALPQTQKRLTFLKNLDYKRVHGSNHTYLENVLPMLSDFGINYDNSAVLEVYKENHIIDEILAGNTNFYSIFYDRLISCPFLLRFNFPNKGLYDFATKRINTIHEFTRHKDYLIYDNPGNHKGVPKPFRNRPIIKPELSYGDKCKLPLIYDILTMAEIYDSVSIDVQEKIDNIIDYVISPGYDVVADGYGILVAPKRRYYAMGWDCKKPFNDKQDYSYRNLHRLLLYSKFPTAAKSLWFQNAVGFLTQFRTDAGTYIFPKEYLPEVDSNWILGSRMSLGENRRKKNWIEIESTFYMQSLIYSNTG